jgi:hypothetical protein
MAMQFALDGTALVSPDSHEHEDALQTTGISTATGKRTLNIQGLKFDVPVGAGVQVLSLQAKWVVDTVSIEKRHMIMLDLGVT